MDRMSKIGIFVAVPAMSVLTILLLVEGNFIGALGWALSSIWVVMAIVERNT